MVRTKNKGRVTLVDRSTGQRTADIILDAAASKLVVPELDNDDLDKTWKTSYVKVISKAELVDSVENLSKFEYSKDDEDAERRLFGGQDETVAVEGQNAVWEKLPAEIQDDPPSKIRFPYEDSAWAAGCKLTHWRKKFGKGRIFVTVRVDDANQLEGVTFWRVAYKPKTRRPYLTARKDYKVRPAVNGGGAQVVGVKTDDLANIKRTAPVAEEQIPAETCSTNPTDDGGKESKLCAIDTRTGNPLKRQRVSVIDIIA